ncbi:unnamed protein product [Musa hybrid cultivar]
MDANERSRRSKKIRVLLRLSRYRNRPRGIPALVTSNTVSTRLALQRNQSLFQQVILFIS